MKKEGYRCLCKLVHVESKDKKESKRQPPGTMKKEKRDLSSVVINNILRELELYLHQRFDMEWLCLLHTQGKGRILGVDMGLEKTGQICGFLAGLYNSGLIERILIVAPATLMNQWADEFRDVYYVSVEKYFRQRLAILDDILQQVLQGKGFLLITYNLLRIYVKSFCHGRWDYMILDEGHCIKNPNALVAESVRKIDCDHCNWHTHSKQP